MHTNYTFPGILQWYEVIRTEQLTLSPVCTANEAVKSACKELQKEIDKTKKDSSIDAIKSLSMKLQGMISASVQGGIPKYQEVRTLWDAFVRQVMCKRVMWVSIIYDFLLQIK